MAAIYVTFRDLCVWLLDWISLVETAALPEIGGSCVLGWRHHSKGICRSTKFCIANASGPSGNRADVEY